MCIAGFCGRLSVFRLAPSRCYETYNGVFVLQRILEPTYSSQYDQGLDPFFFYGACTVGCVGMCSTFGHDMNVGLICG